MKTEVPQLIQDICQKVGIDQRTALWNCHGTWVMYHKALEKVAAHQNIRFDLPTIIEHDAEKRICVMLVKGKWNDKEEWTIGEAMPINIDRGNNKQQYPFAMAEKRAKDRVILKLLGLHGHVYSQEEFGDPNEDLRKKDALEKTIEPKPKAHSAPGNVDPRKYWEQWANAEMKTFELKNRQQLFGWVEGNKPKLGKIKQEGFFDLLETIQTTWDKHYSAKEG